MTRCRFAAAVATCVAASACRPADAARTARADSSTLVQRETAVTRGDEQVARLTSVIAIRSAA